MKAAKRAQYLLESLVKYSRDKGIRMPHGTTTPYLNTVSVEDEKGIPGDQNIEHRIRAFVRWNAAAIVLRAGKKRFGIGWTHCIFPISRHYVRSRLQPLLES